MSLSCRQADIPAHLWPAVSRMLEVVSLKSSDYASGSRPWANFEATAAHFAIPLWEAADFNEIQKLARLKMLRQGRQPRNEPVLDTYLDKANYAMMAFAMYLESQDDSIIKGKA